MFFIVFLPGPPVFTTSNEESWDSNMESTVEIKINVYSLSVIKCHIMTEVNSISTPLSDVHVKIRHVLLKENFYDATITINGTEIIFVLHGLNFHGSRKFNVTVCNSYGPSSFVVEVCRCK